MAKALLGVLALSILTMMGPTSPQHGCQNAVKSFTNLSYPPKRDMRTSIALLSQRGFYRAPDTASVPIQGRDRLLDAAALEANFRNPQPPTEESILRGDSTFVRLCVPCHGPEMKGNGPVAAKFIPPPDILGATTRGRTDGYIYRYIRFGGAVMPTYGAQVTAQQAYDLINFIRDRQRKNPR
jgi:mono/diheme cytochrome c family protein